MGQGEPPRDRGSPVAPNEIRRGIHQEIQPATEGRTRTSSSGTDHNSMGDRVWEWGMPIDIGRVGEAPSSDVEEAGAKADEEQKPPQLVYGSAEEFLHEQLLPTYVRDVDRRAAKWCIEWYFHPEAVSRVEALGRAWEHLRLDGATASASGGRITRTTT